MIDQTRVYEYQPRALARDRARRRAERLRALVLRVIAIALIALAIYTALASLRQASATAGEPCQLPEPAPAECRVSDAPYVQVRAVVYLPIVAREEGSR